jgi:alpha-methylacyl-CoA racemase
MNDSDARPAGVLSGLRVVEMAGLGPAPYAAMLLADLGAEVIRVDRTDRARAGDRNARLRLLNRGRRSLALDLKSPQGRDAVLRLAAGSAAIIEGFRPGVMERLGLGPADCFAVNGALVYGRMTGWGQDGPLSRTVGHDINYVAVSGALHTVGRAGEPPVPPVNFLADFGGGGTFLVIGLLAALWESARSGRGQVVDAAMVDGSATFTSMLRGFVAEGRWKDQPGVNFSDTGSHYYEVYRCADGRFLSVGAIEPHFYADLLQGLGFDADGLPAQTDATAWTRMKEMFAERIATRTRDEWVDVFAGLDACVAPVLSLEESARHEHNVARGSFVERDGVVQPVPAPRFDRTPSELGRPAPYPGEHTREILGELGYGEVEIDSMVVDGAAHQGA